MHTPSAHQERARAASPPAIALAAFSSKDDPLLLVLAADNVIEDEIAFNEAINHAIPLAEAGKLVSFGIVANQPHTGYGYIKKGTPVGGGFIVDRYVEKPPIEKANELKAESNES